MKSAADAGRVCLGLAAGGSGAMQVVNAAFVRLVPAPPSWLPDPRWWAVATGAALVGIGMAIVAGWRTRPAALGFVALLAGPFLLRVGEAMGNPWAGFMWTNPAKTLALAGGAWVAASGTSRARSTGACLLAVFLLVGGIQHFVYAGFVDTLVPAWIPPSQRFWTLFTAVALLASGMGLLIPRSRWLAGILSGAMIFLWVLLLHVPRSIELRTAFELAGVFEATGLAGVAWLAAGERAVARSRAGP